MLFLVGSRLWDMCHHIRHFGRGLEPGDSCDGDGDDESGQVSAGSGARGGGTADAGE